MPQFGSNPSVSAQNLSATQDPNGNPIISSENGFGASPLGVAARTQALYGIPNAHFDLTCADPNSAVEVNNAIPYWDLEYSGAIATTMVYDATTQNWSVRMDPTGAETDDFAVLKARTYLLNDSDLALRQKAFASLTKVGTTGTAQWSIVLSATYYDIAGNQLSTFNIGTAADTGTWTGISGVTTSGSAAISTSAAYADIALTLTAAGSVSGTAKVDINSVLIATSQAAGGSSSFLITETFLSSGTWTRPTGVDYVTVVAMGGGGGGGSGGLRAANTAAGSALGGNGGTASPWLIHRDLYVGGTAGASVSVGIGAGGAGGTAMTFTKAAAGTAQSTQAGATGALGGATTFGSFLSVGGGGSATFTDAIYIPTVVNGRSGGLGGFSGANSGINAEQGLNHGMSSYTGAPFTPAYVTAGSAGANGVGTGSGGTANGTGGTANGLLGIGGSGGGGGGANQAGTVVQAGNGGFGGAGVSGSGGGGACQRVSGTQTVTVTGGAGGNATTVNLGGGGGGGGAAVVGASNSTTYNASTLTVNSGAGGSGQSGFLTVAWIA